MAVANDEDETDEAPQYQSDGRMLTNIVMTGMGEPLYNFDHVRDALTIVLDCDGLSLRTRRITLSTSGVVPMMARAGRSGERRVGEERVMTWRSRRWTEL